MLLGVGVQLALRMLGGRLAAREDAAREHAEHDQRQQHHEDQNAAAAALSFLSGHMGSPFPLGMHLIIAQVAGKNPEIFLKSRKKKFGRTQLRPAEGCKRIQFADASAVLCVWRNTSVKA